MCRHAHDIAIIGKFALENLALEEFQIANGTLTCDHQRNLSADRATSDASTTNATPSVNDATLFANGTATRDGKSRDQNRADTSSIDSQAVDQMSTHEAVSVEVVSAIHSSDQNPSDRKPSDTMAAGSTDVALDAVMNMW